MRRQRLHARIAEAIGPGATGDRLARRATHLVAALPLADPAEAFEACRAAALAAEQRWHSDSAAHWWAAALQALDLMSTQAGDGVDRDEVLIAQVTALARSGRGQTVLDVVDAALIDAVRDRRFASAGRLAASLLRTCGAWPWAAYGPDPGPLLARLVGLEPLVRSDPGAHARILATLAVGSTYDPDSAVPDTLSRRAIDLAEALDDPDVLADALLGRAITFAGVAERAQESIELLDRLVALPHWFAEIDEVQRHNIATMATMTLADTDATANHVRLGAAGSDVLRLPVSRVQLRWMEAVLAQWSGDDLAHAETLYEQARDLHWQTELHSSDAHDIAVLSLRWDQGRLSEVSGLGVANPPVRSWAAAVVGAARDDPDADRLVAEEIASVDPVVWTTHGRLTMLAHAVADRGLREQVPALRALLEPLAHRVATIGQVGVVGPVALALARLCVLSGDLDGATDHLQMAVAIADRARSRGSQLRCRVLAAQVDVLAGREIDHDELRATAAAASARGMRGVARDATALLGRPRRAAGRAREEEA